MNNKKTAAPGRILPEEQRTAPRAVPGWIIAIAVGAMMALVIGLSAFIFAKASLRLDEAQSLFQASRSPRGLLRLVAEDVHVPFYHMLLHYWLQIFGNDIRVVRFLSLLFFALTIPATYALGRYAMRSRSTGLFAALLLTVSPFMNWYGSEARMYSMLAFFTVLNQLYFLKVFRENKKRHWILYALTAVAGMYTHYFFAFVLATQAVFFVVRKSEFPRKSFRKFGIVILLVIGALAPWLLYVSGLGFASNTRPSLTAPTSIDLFNTYSQFIFGFQVDKLNTIIVSLWPALVLLMFFGLQKNRKVSSEMVFIVMAAVVPVIGAFILSILAQPFYLSRYLIVALPALFLFISWMLASYPRQIAGVLRTGLLILVAAAFIVQVINPYTPVKEDYSAANKFLTENANAQDVIIVSAPFTIYPFEYYYRGMADLTTLPYWDRFRQGSIPAFSKARLPDEVKRANGVYQRAWLVLSFDQGYQKDIKSYYDNHYQRLETKFFSPGLNVYAYKLRYDKPIDISETPKP